MKIHFNAILYTQASTLHTRERAHACMHTHIHIVFAPCKKARSRTHAYTHTYIHTYILVLQLARKRGLEVREKDSECCHYVCMYVDAFSYTCLYIYIYIYICIYVYRSGNWRKKKWMLSSCLYVCMYVDAYAYTCLNVYVYVFKSGIREKDS